MQPRSICLYTDDCKTSANDYIDNYNGLAMLYGEHPLTPDDCEIIRLLNH